MQSLPAARVILPFIWLVIIGCSASAQSGTDLYGTLSRPTVSGAGRVDTPETLPGFQASAGEEILRHRDFTGAPCLSVYGSARPQVVDPNLLDDVITVTNSCPQRIALRVCYYESGNCMPMDVPGGERQEAVLGTSPSTTGSFRFEFREKF